MASGCELLNLRPSPRGLDPYRDVAGQPRQTCEGKAQRRHAGPRRTRRRRMVTGPLPPASSSSFSESRTLRGCNTTPNGRPVRPPGRSDRTTRSADSRVRAMACARRNRPAWVAVCEAPSARRASAAEAAYASNVDLKRHSRSRGADSAADAGDATASHNDRSSRTAAAACPALPAGCDRARGRQVEPAAAIADEPVSQELQHREPARLQTNHRSSSRLFYGGIGPTGARDVVETSLAAAGRR